MSKKRQMVRVTLTDEQRALLTPLFDAVKGSNLSGTDASIIAQVWHDGIVATVVSGEEVRGVQAVLQPQHPWRGHSTSAARMLHATDAVLHGTGPNS